MLVPVKTEDDGDHNNDKRSTAAARYTSGGTLDVHLSGSRHEVRALTILHDFTRIFKMVEGLGGTIPPALPK
jgi:hypothetical protein